MLDHQHFQGRVRDLHAIPSAIETSEHALDCMLNMNIFAIEDITFRLRFAMPRLLLHTDCASKISEVSNDYREPNDARRAYLILII